MLTNDLLNILACPVCKGELRLIADDELLHCEGCGRDYPVRDGIPVLLAEQADGDADRG